MYLDIIVFVPRFCSLSSDQTLCPQIRSCVLKAHAVPVVKVCHPLVQISFWLSVGHPSATLLLHHHFASRGLSKLQSCRGFAVNGLAIDCMASLSYVTAVYQCMYSLTKAQLSIKHCLLRHMTLPFMLLRHMMSQFMLLRQMTLRFMLFAT